MEASIIALIPVLVKVITEQLREDLLHMLMGSKCCRWSKRKIKKLHDMLSHIEPDIDAIQEIVRRISTIEEDDDPEDEQQYASMILEYVNMIFPQKITEI